MDQFTPDECARITCQDFKDKFDRIQQALDAKNQPKQVLSFVETLLRQMPRTVLEELADDEFVAWGPRLYDLIAGQKKPYQVWLEPSGREHRWYLVSLAADAYFLFDALQNHLLREHLHFRIFCHPLLQIDRSSPAPEIGLPDGKDDLESLIWIELEGLGRHQVEPLIASVGRTIGAVQKVQQANSEMRQRLQVLTSQPDLETCWPLLHWLGQHNFVITSYRQLLQPGLDAHHQPVSLAKGTSLGLPTELDLMLQDSPLLHHLPDELQHRLLRGHPVVLEELAERSPFHRTEHLTCIGIRQQTADGWKDHLFYGFFTQKAQDDVAWTIFSLRSRVERILTKLAIPRYSHDYSKSIEIINAFPKVELFLMSDRQLTEVVRTFPLFYRHEGVRLIPMPRLSPSRLTLLMILPKDYYSHERIGRIENYLRRHFKADAVSSRIIHVSKSYMSLHVHIQTLTGYEGIDDDKLEAALTRLALPWPLVFRRQLEAHDQELALARYQRFVDVFDEEYRTHIHPRYAVRDVRILEQVLTNHCEEFDLWGPFQEGDESYYQLQFYSLKRPYLNELMPILENLQLSVIQQVDFELEVDGTPVTIKSFSVRFADLAQMDMSFLRDRLLEALRSMRFGLVENDLLNQLLPLTGLNWQQIDIFRGYRNYYFQLGTPYTKQRVAQALIKNPEVALLLYRYFEGRFKPDPELADPMNREEECLSPVRQELSQALEQVIDINEDRILRTLFNLIDATVRTNVFLRQQSDDYFFAFKISSMGVLEMPAPRPLFEVYVHSATMEGIHLRGGKVARGGIRWSDRPDDFRTEVLGLMKAQMTKNAVIVPVGSKGGFVVKTPWQDREEGLRLSKEAYKTLMRGLLDLTDNRVAGEILRPEGIVGYDDEDPYLVVAADKGTAHLPDTANAVAAEYDFWLGDAFASGGSYGYDHKKLGITAKGAWESVKRHFREMGQDTQSEPFTVIGVGDMSGDVFGNGMLLSPFIRLKAAFNHRHIFIDPDPDPAVSYAERQRLFELPRSTWSDYDLTLISKGGGVYDRAAKEIPVSAELGAWLGIRHNSIDGQELVRLLLLAEIDLLWNGGIGTYVKSSDETHEAVGDRANDGVRIDASQLRAKVVGEGGNLGLTQRARVEYAQAGGRINTDALDNSAGVDCSDHEVNIKIFLQYLLQQQIFKGMDEVHSRVEAVTDDVTRMVLENNYTQSLCLTLDLQRCQQDVEPYLDLMDRLGGSGLLDRNSEFMPNAKTVRGRKDRSFTRPELFVLMAYSKMYLYRALLESDLPDRPESRALLLSYFPPALQEEFGSQLYEHPLGREIAATVMTNRIVDQAGSPLWHLLASRGGARTVQAAETYLFFDAVYGAETLRQAIWGLDNQLPAEQQTSLLVSLERVLSNASLYALEQDLPIGFEGSCLQRYRTRIEEYRKVLAVTMSQEERDKILAAAAPLIDAGMAPDQAEYLATLPSMNGMLPLFQLVDSTGANLSQIYGVFAEVAQGLKLPLILQRLQDVPQQDRWDRQAAQALIASLESIGYRLTQAVMEQADGKPDVYWGSQRGKWRAYRALLEQVRSGNPRNFHPFNVLARAMESLLPN